MGGGDLNLKKSWHPGTFRNQEKVWKEERKAADEEKKLQQLRKELEEERQIQELQRIQEQAGGKKRSDRLDWMYQAPPTGAAKDEKALEDYLLGKRRVDEILNKKDSGMQVLSKDSNSFMNQASKANSVKDIQAKVREDPLLAIKRREQASLEALMKNPIKMRQLKESKEPKRKKSKKSRDEKEGKDEKQKMKSRHHSSKRRSSRDRGQLSDSSDNDEKNWRSSRKQRRLSASSDNKSPERTSRRHEETHSSRSHHNSGHSHRYQRSSPSRSRSPDRSRSSRDVRQRSYSRSVSPSDHRRQPRSRSPYKHSYSRSSRRRDRSRSRSPRRSLTQSPTPGRDRHRTSRPLPPRSSTTNRRPAPGGENPQFSAEQEARRKAALDEEKAKRKAALAEERERRLQAMTDNAAISVLERRKRLVEIAEEEAKQDADEEAMRASASRNGQASFLRSTQESAYNGMSLADRVQRGRATLQSH